MSRSESERSFSSTFIGTQPIMLFQDILDIDTYIFNLTEANRTPDRTPVWFKSYSMKDAYGLDNLSPENIHQFVEQMFNDEEKYCLYWRFV